MRPKSRVGRRMSSRRLEPSDVCLGFRGSCVEETCLNDEPSRPVKVQQLRKRERQNHPAPFHLNEAGGPHREDVYQGNLLGTDCLLLKKSKTPSDPEVYLLKGNNRGHLLSPSVGIS